MHAPDLLKVLNSAAAPLVIDVRSSMEYQSGHIPGAVHVSVLKILLRLDRLSAYRQRQLVVTCEHGPRAQLARSVLARSGHLNPDLLEGHMADWRQAGMPLEK